MQVVGGLLDEAHALRQAGLAPSSTPVARAIGYRQALEWLDEIAQTRAAGADEVRQLAAAIQAASRQLAGSQIKFHRKDEHFLWVDATTEPAALCDSIIRHFNAAEHVGVSLSMCVRAVCWTGWFQSVFARICMFDMHHLRRHVSSTLVTRAWFESLCGKNVQRGACMRLRHGSRAAQLMCGQSLVLLLQIVNGHLLQS
jgi:hypothetical protein